MKKLLLITTAIVFCFNAIAQKCGLKEVSLAQRTANSSLIVEGKVIEKYSFWNAAHNMIYTSNTVEIYKIFKGNVSTSTIEIITEGGVVGLNMVKVNPSLSLNVGETGVFTCQTPQRYSDVTLGNRSGVPQYEVYASVQGFIKYDLQEGTATDAFKKYTDVRKQLYTAVLAPSMQNYKEVKAFDVDAQINHNENADRAPAFTFSPGTLTAGTGTAITLNSPGSLFGSTRGSGYVEFANADDGGSTYIIPLASQYISWSSSEIIVEVPQNAGSGTIKVITGGGADYSSSVSLIINYAHLNVDFDPGPGVIAYQTDHVDDNGSGGYTWRMNTGFDADVSARASFMRAFDSWRCATGVNWTIGANTSINDAVSDGTNIICFDNTAPLSPGILGVCYSYWSGCASGPTIIWYVNELDIIFDEGSNISPLSWEYGPSTPSGSEYDFETVALHELGHGHQLGHVNSPGAIMHYAIANGTSNRTLGVNDLAGGNFVQAKSLDGNICGPGAMTSHSCGTPPVAAFSGSPTTVCQGGSVSFTDQSTNTPTSWSWTFTGGTPSSSTAQNPTVTYNTPGIYTVELTATNTSGSDGETKTGYITVNAKPTAGITGATVICSGASATLTATGGIAYSWNTGAVTASITVTPSGLTDYTVTVVDANGCTDNASATVTVNSNPSPNADVTSVSCNGENDGAINVTVSGGEGPFIYSWNPSGGTTEDRTNLAPGTYSITVIDANGCTGQNAFTVSEPAALGISTSIIPAGCSNNDGAIDLSVSGGSPSYTYSWSNGAVTQDIGGLAQGTYSVSVTDANGCGIQLSTFVAKVCGTSTKVSENQCGQNVAGLSSGVFNCDAVIGAQDYEWEFSNTGLNYSVTKKRGAGINSINRNLITGLQYGVSYNVKVKARIAGVWGSYGDVCVVTIVPAGTKLSASQCGQTFADLSGHFYCDAVTGAENYQWEFTNVGLGYTYIITRGSATTSIAKNLIAGLLYGNTYNVRVRAKVNGIWGSFGTICAINIASSSTQLISSQCNQTIPDLSGHFYCNTVVGAEDYQWEFTNVGLSYTFIINRGSSITSIAKTLISGLRYGNTYNVRVRAKVGGAWGSYNTSCSITIAPSATQMITSQCNTAMNLAGYFNCNAVAGAEDYQWEISNVGLGYSSVKARGTGSASIQKSWFTGLQNGTTYDVRVRAKVGGDWGSFGNVCTVTINTSLITIETNEHIYEASTETDISVGEEIKINVYPNPSNNTGFSLNVEKANATQLVQVEVYNMQGSKVWSGMVAANNNQTSRVNTSGELSPGVYMIKANVDGKISSQRIVVQ